MRQFLKSITLRESSSLKKAVRAMDETGLKIILVCSANEKLKGVLSYGDLRRSLLEGLSGEDLIKIIYNRNPVIAQKGDSEKRIKSLALSKISVVGGTIQIPILDKTGKVFDIAIVDSSAKINYFSSGKNFKERSVEKVLVTGGAGYLGSILVRRLLKNGYKVRVLDKLAFGKDSLSNIWANKNFDMIVGDILHIDEVVNAVRDVDAVVHLAATVGDEASKVNPAMAISNNTLATINLAYACKKFQINRLIFTSTCSAYGASNSKDLLTEKSPLRPVSLYAQSKIESEIELSRLTGENFSPTILRLSTLFGWSYRPRFDLVVNFFSLLAYRKKEITVTGGDQWRPFLHVKDAARAVEIVLQSPIRSVAGEIFNVGSNNSNYTIYGVANIIKNILKDTHIKKIEDIKDKRDYKVSFSKIHKTLGFDTEISMEKGILEMLENIKRSNINDLKRTAFNSPGLIASI